MKLATWWIVGLAVVLAAYAVAPRSTAAPEPWEAMDGSTLPDLIVVTPENISGRGIQRDWALVRNGRGLSYWASPEQWKGMARK